MSGRLPGEPNRDEGPTLRGPRQRATSASGHASRAHDRRNRIDRTRAHEVRSHLVRSPQGHPRGSPSPRSIVSLALRPAALIEPGHGLNLPIPPGVADMTNGASPFAWVLRLLALLFLALFAGVWLWVAWKRHRFTPSTAAPMVEFSDAVASTAGLVAS